MKNKFLYFGVFTLLILGIATNCIAQKKRKTQKVLVEAPTTILDSAGNCAPINEDALVTISEKGDLLVSSQKIEKNSLKNELFNRTCGKIPPEQIIYVRANENTLFNQIVEVIKIGRKTEVRDFGLSFISDTTSITKIKVPEEEPFSNKKVKANPRSLTVSLGEDGKIKLNNKPETLDLLKQKLQQIFLTRKQKRVYILGSDEVDKTVFIYAVGTAKFGDVVSLIRVIEKLGAYPIGLDVDNYFLRTIF